MHSRRVKLNSRSELGTCMVSRYEYSKGFLYYRQVLLVRMNACMSFSVLGKCEITC